MIGGEKIMYAKVRISGDIEVKTGMHIGGSSAFSAIGAVADDSGQFFKREDAKFAGKGI